MLIDRPSKAKWPTNKEGLKNEFNRLHTVTRCVHNVHSKNNGNIGDVLDED